MIFQLVDGILGARASAIPNARQAIIHNDVAPASSQPQAHQINLEME